MENVVELVVRVNDVEIAYARWGEGNPHRIMLVHGWTGAKEIWRDFPVSLSEQGFDVVALDLRGHGNSGKPEIDYPHEVFSRDLFELSQVLGWDKYVMLGQSLGGYVCLDYAIRYPDTLLKIIPSNTSVYLARNLLSRITWMMIIRMYRKDPAKMMPKMVPRFFQYPVSEETIEEFTQISLKTAKHAGLSIIQHCFKRNLEPELHTISLPTLVISSQYDQKDLRQATLQIHRLISGSKLVDIPNTGHLPFVENPEEYLNAIVDFVKS